MFVAFVGLGLCGSHPEEVLGYRLVSGEIVSGSGLMSPALLPSALGASRTLLRSQIIITKPLKFCYTPDFFGAMVYGGSSLIRPVEVAALYYPGPRKNTDLLEVPSSLTPQNS